MENTEKNSEEVVDDQTVNQPKYKKDPNSDYKTGVCRDRSDTKFSIRRQGYIFWIGPNIDDWVKEGHEGYDKVWETEDSELAYHISEFLETKLIERHGEK